MFFRNRFVRTTALLAEQAAQKMLYRGAFSVGNPSGGFFFNPFDFAVKGIANTSVLRWGGRLLALYEVCVPTLHGRLHILEHANVASIACNRPFHTVAGVQFSQLRFHPLSHLPVTGAPGANTQRQSAGT